VVCTHREKGADVQRLQQELTELYKQNSANAQELLELNRKVKELTAAVAAKQDQCVPRLPSTSLCFLSALCLL
jgi:chromosome segregation ATPase